MRQKSVTWLVHTLNFFLLDMVLLQSGAIYNQDIRNCLTDLLEQHRLCIETIVRLRVHIEDLEHITTYGHHNPDFIVECFDILPVRQARLTELLAARANIEAAIIAYTNSVAHQ